MKNKITMAHRISVANCECCGGVHVELWRNGKVFAVAIPTDVATAEALAVNLQTATAIMRAAEGKPHVH